MGDGRLAAPARRAGHEVGLAVTVAVEDRRGLGPPLDEAIDEALQAHGHAQVIETAALPNGSERSCLRWSGIATWLCIPTQLDEGAQALLTFDTFGEREWQDDDIALFRTAGEIFTNAIGRERGEADRAALQERLAHAQRLEAVGTLAGGIAHEFNNILGVILAATEMALPSAAGRCAAASNRSRPRQSERIASSTRCWRLADAASATFARCRSSQSWPRRSS